MTAQTTAYKTVELFAGIGGFRIAADRLRLRTVFANDFDASAALVYRQAFGDDVFVPGDIWELLDQAPDHDVLTGGFPCQPFSFAGKKSGVRDLRAGTVSAIRRILETRRPPVFVLENVKSLLTIARGHHFGRVLATLLDAGYAVEWRVRNAMEFGLPQNRQRIVFLGWRHDVASPGVPRLGTEREWRRLAKGSGLEHGDVLARFRSFPTWGRALGGSFEAVNAPTTGIAVPRPLAEVLEPEVDERYDFTASTLRRLRESVRIHEVIDGVEVLWNQEGGRRMGYTVFGVGGASPTLTSTSSRHYERFAVNGRYRRLTPVEYARLQGFPDDHCDVVPHARRYVLFGNAIPPPLAEWGLRRALDLLAATSFTARREASAGAL